MPTQLTPETPETPETPTYQCRHLFTDGHRCGSRALRHEPFCYYHHGTRKPATIPRLTQTPDPTAPFDLPLPEDRSAIQHSLGLIVQRIARNQLDPRRAGLLLYALQIASCNLPKAPKNAEPTETIEEITLDDLHGPLAPQSELHKAPGEKSLEQILMDQWNEPNDPTPNPEEDNTIDLQPPPRAPSFHSLTVKKVGYRLRKQTTAHLRSHGTYSKGGPAGEGPGTSVSGFGGAGAFGAVNPGTRGICVTVPLAASISEIP